MWGFKMKKIITVILTVVLAFSPLSVSAGAETIDTADTSDIDGITSALNAVEPVKEQVGLSGVDFYELTYSDSVNAYDYTKDGLIFNCEFIPIKHEGALVGWVIKKITDGEIYYQFTTAFAEEVNRIPDGDTEFAIIYGYDASYLYDGKDIYMLGSVSIAVEGRGVIESAKQLESENVTFRSIVESYELPYSNPDLNARLPVYFSCNVKYITQNPYDHLCWAASVACIVNYIKKTEHTVISVVKDVRGSIIDKGLYPAEEIEVLKRYGVSYTYRYLDPSADVMLKNIQKGYPIYAMFGHMEGHHAGVVYAVNIMAGYFYVMDPIDGFCNGSYSPANVHMYVSPSTGLAMILDQASCMYWE